MTSTLPPPPPHAADRVARPPDLWRIRPSTRLLVSLGAGGVAFDLGVRHPAGILSVVALALVAGAGRSGDWVRGPLARRLTALSLVPAAMLILRDSPWLTTLNVAATLALLLLAAMVRTEPDPIGRALGRILDPIAALEPAVRSLDLAAASARGAVAGHDRLGRRLLRLGRGLAVAVPVVFTLGALLAASDALFRSWLSVPVAADTVFGHGAAIAVGIALTMALAGHGAWAEPRPAGRPPRILGPTEAAVVLVGVVGVYSAFVFSQVIAITSGRAYVERTTGLTYAEYARAGFFQLVAAAVLTLGVLLVVRRYRRSAAPRLARRLRTLELSTVALTLVTVGVAVRRLFLYEAEFGLTVLRFSTIVVALFIGFVFVVTGLSIAGRLRHDAIAVVTLGALATLVAVNLANPERIIAARNIDRFGGTAELDITYLVDNLGADALPAMLDDPAVAAHLCARPPAIDDRVVVFNWSRARAADALATACP